MNGNGEKSWSGSIGALGSGSYDVWAELQVKDANGVILNPAPRTTPVTLTIP